MVIASLSRKNISVSNILENREYFSAQPKGLFHRNKRKMPRKKIATGDFYFLSNEKLNNGIHGIKALGL